jgi:GMP reductase
MKAVIDSTLAGELSNSGYMYSMHRFAVDITKFVDKANRDGWPVVSISIGVKTTDRELIRNLSTVGSKIDYITVDIAHGHCEAMQNMLKFIKDRLPNTYIIAGNVSTAVAVDDLAKWGADCVKVGIGQGSPCTTKDKTGFTMPMFTCVEECAKNTSDIPIIADGGIRSNGDIAKALTAGASAVMAGGLFASCSDSPARSINIDGAVYKAYYGSASFENKGHKNHVEGILKKIPANDMTYRQKLVEIQQDLQSSISYAGGNTLDAFKSVNYYTNKV